MREKLKESIDERLHYEQENRELIIKKLLLTYWKDKIRIVVTNDVSILENADKTYQIEDKGLRQYIYEKKQQNLKGDGNTGYEKIIKTNKKSMKMEDSEKDRETISSREVLLRYLRTIKEICYKKDIIQRYVVLFYFLLCTLTSNRYVCKNV